MAITHFTPERFWALVRKTDGCWLWLGKTNQSGYGRYRPHRRSRELLAHRIAYEQANSAIPDGLFVCHRCDNPMCVRPDHLFLGTNTDNMRDAASKGRVQAGEQHWSRRNPALVKVGEAVAQHKLTEAEVLEIRRMYAAGVFQDELASRFGVCQSLISLIVRGKRWSHLAA